MTLVKTKIPTYAELGDNTNSKKELTDDEIFEQKLKETEGEAKPLSQDIEITDTDIDEGKQQIVVNETTELPTDFSLEANKIDGVPYRTDKTPKIEGISDVDRGILSAQTGYRNMLASSEPTKEESAAAENAKNEAIDWIDKGIKSETQKGTGISEEEKAKANKTIQDWNNRKTYDPTNKPAQTNEEIIAEIESENPVEETIGDRLRSSYGNDVNVQLGSDGKYYTGEGENPIQISAGSINTTYKDANGVEKQTKSDVYRLADGTYAYEDGNGNIQTLTEAQYQQAKQPTSDANRKAQSFRDEAFRQLRDNPNLTDEELWVYLADKVGKNAYAKDRGLKFGNFFNWKNVVKELRSDFQEEQQRKLQQEQKISNELWNRDARGNLIEGGIVSIVGGKPKTIGDVNSLRRDLISFNENATPEEKATLLNKHLPADKQITAEEANTITDLRSAYNLLKTKGGEEFEEYMELGGVELDADGNVKVQKPIDNLEEYLSEYNTKEKEKLKLDRAKAKRNLELRMEAFRDIAKNISNTIGVSMGANSLGVDNDDIYKKIDDKYRQKVLAYEAKMEQMRQEKMAEKQRKEAIALQEAQMRAAAQKAAADRELEMWKTMAKLSDDRENAQIQANARKYAADRQAEGKESKNPFPETHYMSIPFETKDGTVNLQINKDTWKNYANGKIQNLISDYFSKTDASLLNIIKSDDPTDAWRAINQLINEAVPYGEGGNTNTTMFKDGKTKEQLQEDINKLLWELNRDNSLVNPYKQSNISIEQYKAMFPGLTEEQIKEMIQK
jgi:hypothetical protein